MFASTILALLADQERTARMAKTFYEFAKPNAAFDMADMITAAAKK